ncbi:MAG: ATP-binding protein [Bacteroidaceae bacterium]|nr:ATP-binding protein [Bacteroidaceae bacterium]
MDNPFVTNGYAGPEYFCDRVEETSMLTSLLTNGNNVALMSPRRVGKTDLIRHCFQQENIKEDFYCFLIDIYATNSLHDFVSVFGKSILDALKPKGRKVWEGFLKTLLSVRSEISFDINGNPVWGLGVGATVSPQITLDEIFAYLNAAGKRCIVAIDEFQQILYYNDHQNVEAALRTQIQKCPNANFIFAGSQRHMMSEMFLSPSRPFYQSVMPMSLNTIPLDRYWTFAGPQFAKNGDRRISYEVVSSVYQRFDGITANVQRIMNMLYMLTPKGEVCGTEMIEKAIDTYLQLSSAYYSELLRQMPEKQRNVFLAIAEEGLVHGISSGKFVHKYRLPSASSVMSAVKGLLEKDFITQNENVYYVYDRFFQLWIERVLKPAS